MVQLADGNLSGDTMATFVLRVEEYHTSETLYR